MKLEISEPLELSDEEASLVAAHSLLNSINVLSSWFLLLEDISQCPGGMTRSLEICQNLLASFHDREKTQESIDRIEDFVEVFRKEIDHLLQKALEDPSMEPGRCEDLDKTIINIENILDVLHVRVRELFLLRETPGGWFFAQSKDVKKNLLLFMDVVAKNSGGRFGIVHDKDAQKDSDYLVQLAISGEEEDGSLYIPLLLQDTLRDLVANARKYTPPGGKIEARLECGENGIVLEVSDNGRGIPEGEISKSVRFGYRAGNVDPRETKGGGFGLTKAYYVVRKFGGRMWIDSELGKGTSVTLEIPLKAVTSNG